MTHDSWLSFIDDVIPVQLNDVVFSVHAWLATLITAFQCFFLDRGGQRISQPCLMFIFILVVVIMISCSLALMKTISWLICLNILSYQKLLISLVKYVPQLIMNFRRKSTQGWSTANILLDLSGIRTELLMFILSSPFSNNLCVKGLIIQIWYEIYRWFE